MIDDENRKSRRRVYRLRDDWTDFFCSLLRERRTATTRRSTPRLRGRLDAHLLLRGDRDGGLRRGENDGTRAVSDGAAGRDRVASAIDGGVDPLFLSTSPLVVDRGRGRKTEDARGRRGGTHRAGGGLRDGALARETRAGGDGEGREGDDGVHGASRWRGDRSDQWRAARTAWTG